MNLSCQGSLSRSGFANNKDWARTIRHTINDLLNRSRYWPPRKHRRFRSRVLALGFRSFEHRFAVPAILSAIFSPNLLADPFQQSTTQNQSTNRKFTKMENNRRNGVSSRSGKYFPIHVSKSWSTYAFLPLIIFSVVINQDLTKFKNLQTIVLNGLYQFRK